MFFPVRALDGMEQGKVTPLKGPKPLTSGVAF